MSSSKVPAVDSGHTWPRGIPLVMALIAVGGAAVCGQDTRAGHLVNLDGSASADADGTAGPLPDFAPPPDLAPPADLVPAPLSPATLCPVPLLSDLYPGLFSPNP